MLNETTIFPACYFPPVTMMAAMAQQARNGKPLLVESRETFPKQTYRNRTVILTANGPMTLSVPVTRPDGQRTKTADIGIKYSERWNVIHWRALTAAYNASPYFLYYCDDLKDIILAHHDSLLDIDIATLTFLFKKIKIPAEIHLSDDYHPAGCYANDYREKYSYKRPESLPELEHYTQVFGDRTPFTTNVSVLDALFNLGPETGDYLLKADL